MNKPLFLKQLEEKIFSSLSFKHLGSLHNPLSHGNWSRGAGMYGGAAGGKVGGGLAKAAGDRLRDDILRNAIFRDEKGEAKQKLQSKKFTRAELEQAKKDYIAIRFRLEVNRVRDGRWDVPYHKRDHPINSWDPKIRKQAQDERSAGMLQEQNGGLDSRQMKARAAAIAAAKQNFLNDVAVGKIKITRTADGRPFVLGVKKYEPESKFLTPIMPVTKKEIKGIVTQKHLGSLHNPLSHGNWSKGPGMYGGADKGKAGGKSKAGGADVILGSPPPLAAQARSRLGARLGKAGVRRGVMKRPAREYAAPVGIPRPLGGGRGIAKPPQSGKRGGVKRSRFAPESPDQQAGGNKPKRPMQEIGRRINSIPGKFTSNVERNAARKQRMRDLVKKRIIKTIETANNGGIPPNAPKTVVPQKYPIVPVGPPTSGKPSAGTKPSAGKKPKRPRNVKPGKGPSGPNQFVIPKPPSGGRKPKPVRPFQPPVVVPPTPGGIIPGRPGGQLVPGRPPRTPRFPFKPRPRPNPSDDVVEGDWRVLPKSRFGFNANTLRQVFAGALLLGGLGLAAGGVGAVGGAVGGAAGAVGDFLGIGPEAAAEREAEKKRKAAAGLPTVTKEIKGVVASNITRLLYLHKNDL